MLFRILGPLEVLDGERTLAFGSGGQPRLLLVLLLHANEVVSSDQLIDALQLDGSGSTDQDMAASLGTLRDPGPLGFTWEIDAHLHLKRAWALDSTFGSPGHHADALAEALAAAGH